MKIWIINLLGTWSGHDSGHQTKPSEQFWNKNQIEAYTQDDGIRKTRNFELEHHKSLTDFHER